MNRFIVLALAVLLVSSTAFAKKEKTPLTLGIQLYKEKKYKKAIVQFHKASKTTKRSKQKAEIYFRLGIAYYDLAKWNQAIIFLQKGTQASDIYAQQSHYFIGLCHYTKRDKRSAKSAFRKAIMINKISALTISSQAFLQRLKAIKETQWSTIASASYSYDSNMTIETTNGIISDSRVNDETSSSNALLVQPTYSTFLSEQYLFSPSYTLFTVLNWRRHHRGYNLLKQIVSLPLKWSWTLGNEEINTTVKSVNDISFTGNPDKIGEKHPFKMLVRNHSFYMTNIIRPSATWEFNIPFHYGYYDFKSGQGLDDRDNFKYQFGFENTLYLKKSKNKSIKTGYQLTYNHTYGLNFRDEEHQILYSFKYPTLYKTFFDFSGTVTRKFYPKNGVTRDDMEYIYNWSLYKKIGRYGSLLLFTYVKNDSNVQRYNFRRFLTTFSMTTTF